jgi:hypothetical protein
MSNGERLLEGRIEGTEALFKKPHPEVLCSRNGRQRIRYREGVSDGVDVLSQEILTGSGKWRPMFSLATGSRVGVKVTALSDENPTSLFSVTYMLSGEHPDDVEIVQIPPDMISAFRMQNAYKYDYLPDDIDVGATAYNFLTSVGHFIQNGGDGRSNNEFPPPWLFPAPYQLAEWTHSFTSLREVRLADHGLLSGLEDMPKHARRVLHEMIVNWTSGCGALESVLTERDQYIFRLITTGEAITFSKRGLYRNVISQTRTHKATRDRKGEAGYGRYKSVYRAFGFSPDTPLSVLDLARLVAGFYAFLESFPDKKV